MIDLQQMLVKSLYAYDANRERSRQKSIGPSSLGDCRRKVWFQLQGIPKTNPQTESYAAILGTFIHAGIAEAIKREDPFGDNFLIEQKMMSNDPDCGIESGNIDLFIRDIGIVVDWKTTKKKNLRYFPSQDQRWQVQVYGWLASQNGHKVNFVSLVALPRDGEAEDIRAYVEEYDPAVVEEAFAWLRDVMSRTEAPEPEKPAAYCIKYCEWYGELCSGTTK